jgi:cytochrome c oxidase subunit IV
VSEHTIKPPTYGLVFVALIALTGLTVWLASVDLGAWHVPVGLAIAATKATVIFLFFMHALYSTRLTWAIALATLLFLAILLGLTLTDYLSRHWQTAEVRSEKSGVYCRRAGGQPTIASAMGARGV